MMWQALSGFFVGVVVSYGVLVLFLHVSKYRQIDIGCPHCSHTLFRVQVTPLDGSMPTDAKYYCPNCSGPGDNVRYFSGVQIPKPSLEVEL